MGDNREQSDFIEKITSHAGHILLGSVAFVILIWSVYFINFGGLPAGGTETWGQFGDFVGGTLNSVFAFFSFMVLIASLRLQAKELRLTRAELALTRRELASASDIQHKQVRHLELEATKKDLLYSIDYILTRDMIDESNFVIGVKAAGRAGGAGITRDLMNMDFPAKTEVDRGEGGTYVTDCFMKELYALRNLDTDCAALQSMLAGSPVLKSVKERYGGIARRLTDKGWAEDFSFLNR